MSTDENGNQSTSAAMNFINCPHWGQGGQYQVDPVSGQRVRIEATPDAVGPATPAAQIATVSTEPAGTATEAKTDADAAAGVTEQTMKEKKRG